MRIILYIIAVFLTAGCSYSTQYIRSLDDAERLMAENPEKAFDRLNLIDVSQLHDSSTVARWALLYSEAMAARNLHAPSDSIINIAIEYYGAHRIDDKYRRAQEAKRALTGSVNVEGNALVTALYLQKEKEFMLYKERAKHNRRLLYGLLLLSLAAGIIVWQRQRLKIRSAQTAVLMAEASALRSDISNNRKGMTVMENKLKHLFYTRFNLIDSLCYTYYEAQGTIAERKAIADKVKREIDLIKNDPVIIADMENTVNDCRDNLLYNLKKEYSDLKPSEYRLALYLACGLSNRTISLLLGESIEVVYKRKSRLKNRINNKNAPHQTDFAGIFKQK